ncbi:hypothetical protein ACFLSQ_04585 [Bacteroidota bacterium]
MSKLMTQLFNILLLCIFTVTITTAQESDKYPTPKILTGRLNVLISGDAKKTKIEIRNISIKLTSVGADLENEDIQLRIRVDNPEVEIAGFELLSDPIVELRDSIYSIILEITGKMAKGENMIFGAVSCVMTATAVYPKSGESRSSSKKISIPISYEPDNYGSEGYRPHRK